MSSRRPWLLRPALNTVYSIGIYRGPSPLALGPGEAGVTDPVLTREQVTDRYATFVADPFMIRVGGRWSMFFEVLSCGVSSRKGEIGLATCGDGDGRRWAYQGIVLTEPFHLSYPYVFASGGDVFMIPECAASGSVRLYRADPFPGRWTLVTTLLSGPVLLDSSVFEHEGRWWMLTETDFGRGTLRLFHAPALTGPWREHPRSPIVPSDPGLARPAGRVITMKGRRIRFAQDCRGDYGVSVRALEITRLGIDAYAEVELPGPVLTGSGRGWNALGMHQLDAHPLEDGSWIACVDGWTTRVRRPRELAVYAADHARSALRRVGLRAR